MLHIQDLLNQQNETVQEWRSVRYIADPNQVFQLLNGLKNCTESQRAAFVTQALQEGEPTDLELLVSRHEVGLLNQAITDATRRATFESKPLLTPEALKALGNTRADALQKEAHAGTLEAIIKEAVADFVSDWRGMDEGFTKEGARHLCKQHQWLYLQVALHMWDLFHAWQQEKNDSSTITSGGAETVSNGLKPKASQTPKSGGASRRKKPTTPKSQK